jgi:hypothetical protein
MLRLLSAFAAVLALACSNESPRPPAAPQPAVEKPTVSPPVGGIPAPFHGEWNASLADCGSGRNDSRLRITADRLAFHESSGTVRNVVVHSAVEIEVEADLAGEGQSWRAKRRWRLGLDGATLQDVTAGGGLLRRRCPTVGG